MAAIQYTQPERSTRPRYWQRYNDEIRVQLKEKLGLSNIMEVPTLEKIVLNMGVGKAAAQASLLEGAVKDMTLIAGQKPIITKAKKSQTPKAAPCLTPSASRSSARGSNGKEGTRPKGDAHTQVQGSGVHPLPALWPTAGCVPQVRPVPDLLPPAQPFGGSPGRDQVLVVGGGDR